MECWICLDIIKRQTSYTCPECKAVCHKRCLIEYLTAYNFNRIFCGKCKRIFTNKELRELLTKKDFKVYINKSINASMDYFMKTNMARVNETVYYTKLFKSLNYKDRLFVNMIGKCICSLRSDKIDVEETEEMKNSIITLARQGVDISTLRPMIDPEVVKSLVSDDPVYRDFINIPLHIGRFLFCSRTYSQALEDSEKLRGVITPPIDVPRPLMNCTKCGSLVVKFHKRAYCSACMQSYCKHCGEMIKTITHNDTEASVDDQDIDEDHVCNAESVSSFKTIIKNTKACPKCGVRIQKSEGCSQMFCTHCHTGFDWNTGEIIKHNFHNPHRIEWINKLRSEGQVIDNEIRIEDLIGEGHCNDSPLDVLERSLTSMPEWCHHIYYWTCMLNQIHEDISIQQTKKDILFEAKCVKWLNAGKSLKTIIKTRSGEIYACELLHEKINNFIDTSASMYLRYPSSTPELRSEIDELALSMLTSFLEDLSDVAKDTGRAAIFNGLLHILHFSQYIESWYEYLPNDPRQSLAMVFSQIIVLHGPLDEIMTSKRDRHKTVYQK